MTIDLCYEGIIAKLTKQGRIVDISKKLLTLTNNEERILYVYDIIGSIDAFPDVVQVKKCPNVSKHYRNLGNKCFQQSQNFEAWQYYNLALLHAPIDSDSYVIAISNRSAVLSIFKMYNECLNDIKEIMSRKCPDNLVQKLTRRSVLCEQALSKQCNKKVNTDDDIKNLFTLQGPRNERYVCASAKLEVVFTEKMGRHVVAKEDINVGEVLAQEDPYLTLLLKSQFLLYCSFCLSRCPNLFPCDRCCFSLYCSKECKEKALKEYHEVECPLMATLVHMDFTKLELLALRTVIRARTDHTSWKDLFHTIKEAEDNMNTEFQGHVRVDGKWMYDSKYYESIHTLASNIEKRSISDIFQKSVTAAVFLKFLRDKTGFLKFSKGEDEARVRKLAAGMLLHHCMTSPTNMHGLCYTAQTADGNYTLQTSVASASYAFHSLLNHSCSPNVVRFSKLGTGEMVLFALRPIDKGMQLYDNYGSHHALEDVFSRQYSLKFQYKFTCLCEACVGNWPTYLRMQPARNLPINLRRKEKKIIDSELIEKLQKGDKDTACKLFKSLCDLAQDLDPYVPCIELADCQESLKQCLAIVQGLIPYAYSKLIEWSAIPPKC